MDVPNRLPTDRSRQAWDTLIGYFERQCEESPESKLLLRKCLEDRSLVVQNAYLTGTRAPRTPIDFFQIVERVHADLAALLACREISLKVDTIGQPMVSVDPSRLYCAVLVVFLNAVLPLPRCSAVEITAASLSGEIEIESSDDCPPGSLPPSVSLARISKVMQQLLPHSELSLLGCPQGGVAVHVSMPVARRRLAA